MLVAGWCFRLLSGVVLAHAPALAAQDAAGEAMLLKAAFIYNFAKFTRWPEASWAGSSDSLRLCIAGADDLAQTLVRLDDKTIQGREVAVRHLKAGLPGEPCHMLYIASSEGWRFPRLIQDGNGIAMLTISEIRGFADAGGMIQLYRAGDRIRFRINRAAARQSGLEFSARLLDLADLVDAEVSP